MIPPTMRVPKINPHRSDLPTLMNEIHTGVIRIPGFQRDFVWEPKRIQTLLDSMCKEYPIGTIFLWRAPTAYNHLLRDLEIIQQPPLVADQRYSFLLDGQQRLTSLYVTIHGLAINGEDYSKIVLDLEHSDPDRSLFSKRQRIDYKRFIPVKDLLAYSTTAITRSLPDHLVEKFEHYRNILITYPFSVVTVSDMEIDDAIEIFERINRQGRRLDRYDLIAASVFTKDFDLRKQTEADIQNKITHDFGEIPNGVIPQMLALIIKGNAESSTQFGLDPKNVESSWEQTVSSFFSALNLLRNHFGVVREEFLPYDAILPVLTYYFFHSGLTEPSRDHLLQLERWFWGATFSDRYSGSSQTRISEDAGWIRNLVAKNTEFNYQISAELNVLTEARLTHTTSSVRNGFLCALKLQRPLHFENGTEVPITPEEFGKLTDSSRCRIFSDSVIPNGMSSHSLPNFCFIPSGVTERLNMTTTPPSQYMRQLKASFSNPADFERIMASHLIPVDDDSAIWSDDYRLFLEQRAKLILARIYQLNGAEQTITEDDPVVDAIEIALRDLIDTELKSRHGAGYWSTTIPAVVANEVSKKVRGDSRRSVQDQNVILSDPRKCLDYANPGEYWEIIKANMISASFHGQDDRSWERYLRDFQDYRNTTKHNRKADTLLSAKGLAASIWLSRVLNLNLSKYGVF
ncbi:MAG: DUF262 domain-containing protein [Anaerolineaceae bacterium]|nr:DUF262 domain-containing protein [Anaerolineaceae bacterium]